MKYKKSNWVLVFISAVFFTLSFIGIGLGFLSFIAFIPYLIFLDNSNTKNCFLPGALLGFIISAASLYPIIYVRIYAYIGLIIALSLYFGLLTWFFQTIHYKFKKIFYLLLPFLWVGFEYFMTLGQLNFPWFNLGNTLVNYHYLIQFADISGVYGLSFLVLATNILLYKIFSSSYKYIFAAILIFLLWIGYGVYRDKTIDLRGENFRIGLIQLNIKQKDKWKPEMQEPTIKDYSKQIRKLTNKENLQLIILPESAIPLHLLHNFSTKTRISELAKNNKVNIITGFPDYKVNFDSSKISHKFYNSATMIDKSGKYHKKYDKIRLVPFGERIPLLEKIPILKKLQFGQANFEYGDEFLLYEINDYKFPVMICFEGVFPNLSRKYSLKGADALIVITNDAWFKNTIFPVEHANNTLLRAVETRLPLIRVANTGISYFVSPVGEILRELPIYVKGNFTFNLVKTAKEQKTFFAKYGYVFARLCFWFFLVTLIYSFVINLFLFRGR